MDGQRENDLDNLGSDAGVYGVSDSQGVLTLGAGMNWFFRWEDYAGPQCKCTKYYLCKLHKQTKGK